MGDSRSRRPRGDRGLGLTEVIVATLVATIAVLGLAYTIGSGRGNVNRYEVARAGLAEAQSRLERLAALLPPPGTPQAITAPELQIPGGQPSATYSQPFVYHGGAIGVSSWTVAWYTDPNDPSGPSLRQVTARVVWTTGNDSDAVSLQRFFPAN